MLATPRSIVICVFIGIIFLLTAGAVGSCVSARANADSDTAEIMTIARRLSSLLGNDDVPYVIERPIFVHFPNAAIFPDGSGALVYFYRYGNNAGEHHSQYVAYIERVPKPITIERELMESRGRRYKPFVLVDFVTFNGGTWRDINWGTVRQEGSAVIVKMRSDKPRDSFVSFRYLPDNSDSWRLEVTDGPGK